MTDDRWFKFSDRYLRIRDIDYFEIRRENNLVKITCYFHIGQSYGELEEEFLITAELNNRIAEIESVLDLPNVLL